MTTTVYTAEEVQKHNTEQDLWVIIENNIYDLTKFAKFHPGGAPILIRNAGKDVTQEFHAYHNQTVLAKYPQLIVGILAPSQQTPKNSSTFPYAEPQWYDPKYPSPYYNETHVKFRLKVREFVDREIIPYVEQWEEKGEFPASLREKAVEEGIYGSIWPAEYGGTPPEGTTVRDMFHLLIFVDELSRCGAGGVLWSCFFSFSISLPPILNVGSQYIKDLVARDVITGKKQLALAVTEPSAGSDVASLQTTARLTKNARGENVYIVNGEKRYITNGMKADWYTTAVKTELGISLLLIPRDTPGISTRRQPTQGWLSSNTAFIQFKDVEIPVKNLIGEEGKGWLAIMHNFNQERFVLAAMMNRFSRMCMSDAVHFARNRITFKKNLSEHDVIRHKVAQMCARIEAVHALLETLAYQFQSGNKNKIGGNIALLKVRATDCMDFCTKESMHILGGCGYIRGGTGHRIERLYRETRVNSCGGGSYEIMEILAMKQAKL